MKSNHGFTQFLEQKNIIPKTISRHEREVLKYENWLTATYEKTPENATKKDLLHYLKHIKEHRKLSNATQNQVLQVLKNYYSYLQQQGINNITAFIKIRGIKQRHLRTIFTLDELDLLIDAYYYYAQEYAPTPQEMRFCSDYKNLLQGRYIALTLMAYQAVQLHEIFSLTGKDFDLRKATVTIHQSRTGAERTLVLEAVQISALISYFGNEQNTTLIPNINHFERLSKTLKALHPKYQDFIQLRASKITHWIKQYGLRKAQYYAGPRTITTTEKYIAGDFETLQNDMDNFHPLR